MAKNLKLGGKNDFKNSNTLNESKSERVLELEKKAESGNHQTIED